MVETASAYIVAYDLASTLGARTCLWSNRNHYHWLLRRFRNERLCQGFEARISKHCDQVRHTGRPRKLNLQLPSRIPPSWYSRRSLSLSRLDPSSSGPAKHIYMQHRCVLLVPIRRDDGATFEASRGWDGIRSGGV